MSSNILKGLQVYIKEEIDDDEFDAMVARLKQKAEKQKKLKAQGKEPVTKQDPKTGKYHVDFDDDQVKETSSTGQGGGSAGIGGGAGLGITKSPFTKIIEKPMGEDTAYAGGGGQGGNAGQSYRKFRPKSAGVAEGKLPPRAAFNPRPMKKGEGDSPEDYEYTEFIPRGKERGEEWAIKQTVAKQKLPKQQSKSAKTDFYKGYLNNRPFREEQATMFTPEKSKIAENSDLDIELGDRVEVDAPNDLDWHGRQGKVIHIMDDTVVLKLDDGTKLRATRNTVKKQKDVSEEQAPMFTPEDKMVNANNPTGTGWRYYKAKSAGSKENLDEDVGSNYLYHATRSDIDTLQSIISNGLETNDANQDRTGSKLRAASFTRNWRYALTGKDDDGEKTSNVAHGVILVVDKGTIQNNFKFKAVDRPADFMNLLKVVIPALSQVQKVDDLWKKLGLLDHWTSDLEQKIIRKVSGDSNISTMRQFISRVTKKYYEDPTNKQAYNDAVNKINQTINMYAKSIPSKSQGGTASEYEDVVLTKYPYIPLRSLGFVGYMINPTVDEENRQQIKSLFTKAFGKDMEMPIPNATRPRDLPAKSAGLKEAMPSSILKLKQKYSEMSDSDFAERFKDKTDDELKAMAWRHGYGKDSSYYVNKRQKGLKGTKESAIMKGIQG